MEEEVFFNGFCKAQNQGRMVTAVFDMTDVPRKKPELAEIDCAYETCQHRDSCQIGKQVAKWGK